MSRPRRSHAQARVEMHDGILRLAREQLATRSAGELSVREIARGLGVASSAIYRHVKNRDELITMLITDAYDELADTVVAPADGVATDAGLLSTLAHRVHDWAITNPSRWALIYGSPIPGYSAPPDETTVPGTRVMAALLDILSRGSASDDTTPPSIQLADQLVSEAAGLNMAPTSPELLISCVEAWTSLVGVISSEVFGQLGPEFGQFGTELLDRWVTSTCRRFSLT